MFKRLLQILLIAAACMTSFVGYVWISMATYTGVCLRHSSGYEKHTWYENGKETKQPMPNFPLWFPPAERPSAFESAGIAYDNYELAVECGENREDTWAVNAVRFSVATGFKFAPSGQYRDVAEVPALWANEPPENYIPVNARQATMLSGSGGIERSWITADDKRGPSGHKEFIDTLAIDWLKDEPLDEAHLMGIWRGGWLFHSAKHGYYVWIS